MTIIDHHLRLEPDPRQDDLARGFAAAVHDPLWFLARQWMMGEFHGENASTPVRVDYSLVHTPLRAPADVPDRDPQVVPAEPIIEDEPDSWWTMGRRIRIGVAAARKLDAAAVIDGPYLFTAPPPPYEQFANTPDGLALWRNPPPGLPDSFFDSFGVPPDRKSCWDAAELVFRGEFPTGEAGDETSASLQLPRHRGGRVDWFSSDSTGADFSGKPRDGHAYPSALEYPGAPVSRWWEIEDAAVDIGGYPPDSSHFATTLLIELISSHSDDWFLFPIDVPVGHVSTFTAPVKVTDSFSRPCKVSPPHDWWMFKTAHASESSLVTWLRAMTPLEGPVIEDVLFGLDEYSNRLWAVEQRIAGREASSEEKSGPADPPTVISTAGRKYAYVAGTEPTPLTHAYEVDEVTIKGAPRRRFVQRRTADVSGVTPILTPTPTAEVLRVRTSAGGEVVHEIEPATIPSIGTRLQRRYKLARDTLGRPCLWVERQRSPVLRPPSRSLRFDQFV